MHKDIIEVKNVKKPKGDIKIVYFSSISNNTQRFIEKLKFKNVERIPVDIDKSLSIKENYVLIIPTYSGGNGDVKGAVVKQVIKFLNDEENRKNCYGVIASGNTNFGDTFCLAGIVVSKKLNVPLLYQFELLGNKEDVKNVEDILERFWEK